MEGPSLTTSSDLGISVSTNRVSQQDTLATDRPATPGTQPISMVSPGPKACIQCGQTKTPLWRSGPAGPKTLCNACGVHYQRTVRRSKSTTPRAATKAPADFPLTDQPQHGEDEGIKASPLKRSAQAVEDQATPVSTGSEPESQNPAQQASRRPKRQRRRKIMGLPSHERTTDRTFGSEGFNRLDTLVAAAGEETDWQAREEDDHSGQTTQRESAEEEALEHDRLLAQVEDLSSQLEAKTKAHKQAMEDKQSEILSLNHVVKELLTSSLKTTEALESEKGSHIEQLQLGLQKQINVSLALQDLYTRSHKQQQQNI